jgi:hypothetical protein
MGAMDDADFLLLRKVEDYMRSLRSSPQRDRLLKDIRTRLATHPLDKAPDGKMAEALRKAGAMGK